MNLTAEQQALVNTNFGEEMEKEAAARVSACNEAYDYGFAKLAKEVADARDEEEKKEKEEKGEKEEKMDEESEKAAAELGMFIERGYTDGLRKLGSERHGDEFYYFAPEVIEKVAASKGMEAAKGVWNKIKGYHGAMAQDVKAALKPSPLAPSTRARAAGAAALRASPYAALGLAGGVAASGKKDKE